MRSPPPSLSVLVLSALCMLFPGCASTPAQPVTIGKDRQVATRVAGSRAPTIVLQSGLGDGMGTWNPVFDRLAAGHRVFAYDRPGYGGSRASGSARDPIAIAAELRQTLRAAGIAPPYLLVGHSIGGLYQYAFAKLYPHEVVGVILLDPTHPEHWARMQNEAPAAANLVRGLRATVFSRAARAEFDAQAQGLDRIDLVAPLASPSVILTRSRFSEMEKGPFETMIHRLEADWESKLGPRTKRVRVPGAGHYIHRDQPTVVCTEIEALLRSVEQTKRRGAIDSRDGIEPGSDPGSR